jgi:assimilatory nitrate reductase electron transfer subunit
VEEVAAGTRATTGCGGCTVDVCALIDALRPSPGNARPETAPTASPTSDLPREDDVTKGKHMIHSAETAAS